MRTLNLLLAVLVLSAACATSKDLPEDTAPLSVDPDTDTDTDTDTEPVDLDEDGYDDTVDCDDDDADVNPGADETCDGVDNDCDGKIDEGLLGSYYTDADEDGFGGDDTLEEACEQPDGTTTISGDCDDSDPDIHPDADELCDGVDNNCDDSVDGEDAIDPALWYADADGDGYGDAESTTEACDVPSGYLGDDSDCDDTDADNRPGAIEYCDEIDNNCDGLIDEDPVVDGLDWHPDDDGDGYGDPDETHSSCSAPPGFISDDTDCDDTRLRVHPGATEECNSVDDDCDGTIDEGFTFSTYYRDADSDGHGDFTEVAVACGPLAGHVTTGDDCDDTEYWSHPGLSELCDEIDNDCDGEIDEELTFVDFYPDADGDGYGSAAGPVITDCIPPPGHVVDTTDCDDALASVNPGAIESCNGIDDNCNGEYDEGLPVYTFYWDADGDDYGVPEPTVTACDTPDGYAPFDTDCDDSDDHIHPGAYELCNEVDDDCDDVIDDDCGDLREFVLFVTDAFISTAESTWLETREDANAYCQSYAESHDIDAEDFRIVYSTEDEAAKDYLVYDGGLGNLVYDVEDTLIDELDLWDGTDIRLPDMVSWTITGTWNDGDFHECTGSYPSGSWPICQFCAQKFACGSSLDNPFEPGACCWTGTRAIVCMGTL